MVIVHNKASLEPAEELKILLQNFIAILFSELNNMISSDCIHRVPAQVISDTILNAAKATKRVFFTDEKNLSQPSCKQSEQPCLGCREEVWGGWESPCGSKSQVCIMHMLWFRLASASPAEDDCTSYRRRPRWMQNFTLILARTSDHQTLWTWIYWIVQ